MKKTAKKKASARMGRPPKQGTTALKSLGSVRVTADRLDRYTEAAAIEEIPRADWIRDSLDSAAERTLRRAKRDA